MEGPRKAHVQQIALGEPVQYWNPWMGLWVPRIEDRAHKHVQNLPTYLCTKWPRLANIGKPMFKILVATLVICFQASVFQVFNPLWDSIVPVEVRPWCSSMSLRLMDNVRERLVKTTPCGWGMISGREAGYMCRRARLVPHERRARKKSCSDGIFLGDSDLEFACSQGERWLHI